MVASVGQSPPGLQSKGFPLSSIFTTIFTAAVIKVVGWGDESSFTVLYTVGKYLKCRTTICHLPVIPLGTHFLTFLSLSFLICD